jgi:hypothetical protein
MARPFTARVIGDDGCGEGQHDRLQAVVGDVAVEELGAEAGEGCEEYHDRTQGEERSLDRTRRQALHCYAPIT